MDLPLGPVLVFVSFGLFLKVLLTELLILILPEILGHARHTPINFFWFVDLLVAQQTHKLKSLFAEP